MSAWNRIAHRLFSPITINWSARPLVSHEAVGQLILVATTWAGLRVNTTRDQRRSQTDVKIPAEAMIYVNFESHAFYGKWVYTVCLAEPSRLIR